jgi:hypothetical protein
LPSLFAGKKHLDDGPRHMLPEFAREVIEAAPIASVAFLDLQNLEERDMKLLQTETPIVDARDRENSDLVINVPGVDSKYPSCSHLWKRRFSSE